MENVERIRKKANQPLRMDYSDVYIKNARLQDELARTLNKLDLCKNRQVVDHNFEIRKLTKKLTELQSLTKSRPKSSKLLFHRTHSAQKLHRPTSAFASVVKVNVKLPVETSDMEDADSDTDLSSSDNDVCCYESGKKKKKSKIVSKLQTTNSHGSVSIVRPSSCLPAVGLTSKRSILKPPRSKSAHPRSTTTETSTTTQLHEVSKRQENKNLMRSRQRPASASMSLRQLKQMCHQQNKENEPTDVVKASLEKSRLESERLQARVRLFVKSMDGWVCSNKKKPFLF